MSSRSIRLISSYSDFNDTVRCIESTLNELPNRFFRTESYKVYLPRYPYCYRLQGRTNLKSHAIMFRD